MQPMSAIIAICMLTHVIKMFIIHTRAASCLFPHKVPSNSQWRSQNTADARAQRGHTTFASSLVPRPCPPLIRLQYGMQKQLGGSGGCSPGIFELPMSILRLL